MSYKGRMGIAATASLLMHAGVISLAGYGIQTPPPTEWANETPLVISLNRPSALDQRTLIDGGAPSEVAPKASEFITDKNTQAQDLNEERGDTDRPFVEEVGDVDQLPVPGGTTSEPTPPPPEMAESATKPAESEAAEPVEETPEPVVEEPSAALALEPLLRRNPLPVAENAPESKAQDSSDTPETPPKPEALPERFEIARAPAPKPGPSHLPAPHSSRLKGGVNKKGFRSFEAHEHLLAPYLLKIRKAVERQWRAGIHFRFSGSSRALAVIDCAIAPDGRLVFARVVDPGRSASYAALCRRSVENAGPFEPFPFKVPMVYRNQNLEIRWTFSYM